MRLVGVHVVYVQSSNITRLAYHAESNRMQVTFRAAKGPGTTYEYDAVPRNVWDTFHASDSKGSHFANHIRGHFAGRKLDIFQDEVWA